MTCEICRKDLDDTIVILPIRQADGKLVTLACPPCAQQSSAYCQAHQAPHMGFAEDTTACLRCIDEEVVRQAARAPEIWARLIHALPAIQVSALISWAAAVRARPPPRAGARPARRNWPGPGPGPVPK